MSQASRFAIGHLASHRSARLFLALAGFFITDALLAEFVGVKIFSLERTLGIDDVHWSLLGASGTLSFTAGVIYWPLVFILTDIINEYFGLRGVRLVSWLAVAFISWAFLCAYVAISLAPAPFWVDSNAALGVPDIQKAFALIFGQGMWTIVGSIVAFLVGQLIDVTVFQRIRRLTGERWMWLRATGSTAVSQLFDSFIVLYIAFVIGPQHWPVSQFLAVGTVNYLYKMLAAILTIPLLYLVHAGVRRYLGAEETARLRREAAAGDDVPVTV
jgi:queuosine precursor transporter